MGELIDSAPTCAGGNLALVARVKAAGVTLSRDGPVWIGTCPFHKDDGQFLLVDPSRNHWQCDGECQTGGSVVDWIMKTEHVSRAHAMELLRRDVPASASIDTEAGRTTVRKLEAPFDPDEDDQQVLRHVIEYYHSTLQASPDAQSYLQKRGICSDALEHFKLGFSNRTLCYRLPEKNRKAGATLRGRLQRLGVLRASGHEHFRGSIVVPIINDGHIKQVYGRKISDHHRKGTPLHTYLWGPRKGVFNLEAVQISDELVLCQSVLDALTFWCAGHRNVTCSYGIEGFADEHLAVFKQYAIKRVLIAYAANEAAERAAVTLADRLIDSGIDVYRIEFPRHLDANAYAVQANSASQALGDAIRKAVWLGKGQAPEGPRSGMAVSDAEEDTAKSLPDSQHPEPKEDYPPKLPKVGTDAAAEVSLDNEHEDDDDRLPAVVAPPAPVELDAEIKDKEVTVSISDRRYRVRGLDRNLSCDQLKVNILVSCQEALHVDTFDLYATRPRAAFIRQAAIELGVSDDLVKQDLSKLLLKLEVLQDAQIQQALAPKPSETTLSKKARTDAMALLKSPNLIQRILDDFQRCGVVGEQTNKLVGYLATISRKLDHPLAIVIQSTSAAGKSALMDAVLAFVPEEDRLQYSAMTGQSLFYMASIDLRHKILAISEEAGVSHAAYALKLLQSDGQLTIATTGKDANSGKHVTHEYKVDGPVMIFTTTTAINIDEELLNRCLVLTVDEERSQTEAIHEWQRYQETLDGMLAAQAREDIITIHRNAQRLLKPLKVVNPYARQLTFLSDKTRCRRDHTKYLALIRSIALLHQYQREVKTAYVKDKALPYVEVTLDDIALANQIAHEVLGRSLDDLPPQTRRLLQLIDRMVTERCRSQGISRSEYQFGRRDICEYIGWGDTQLKVHLKRLEAMEYLLILRGGRGQRIVYELLYNSEGQDGTPFLAGLIDVETLREAVTEEDQVTESSSGTRRHKIGGLSGRSRGQLMGLIVNTNNKLDDYRGESGLIAGYQTKSIQQHTRNADHGVEL